MEKGNVTGYHAQAYSGLSNKDGVDVYASTNKKVTSGTFHKKVDLHLKTPQRDTEKALNRIKRTHYTHRHFDLVCKKFLKLKATHKVNKNNGLKKFAKKVGVHKLH